MTLINSETEAIMSEMYTIKRDGETVGMVSDRQLAEKIDGMEIHNDAADPAYSAVHTYNVPEL